MYRSLALLRREVVRGLRDLRLEEVLRGKRWVCYSLRFDDFRAPVKRSVPSSLAHLRLHPHLPPHPVLRTTLEVLIIKGEVYRPALPRFISSTLPGFFDIR